jgi:hypothetical protein
MPERDAALFVVIDSPKTQDRAGYFRSTSPSPWRETGGKRLHIDTLLQVSRHRRVLNSPGVDTYLANTGIQVSDERNLGMLG